MERSNPSSGRSATPADINRNARPTSIGMGGRHHRNPQAWDLWGGVCLLWPIPSPCARLSGSGGHSPRVGRAEHHRTPTYRRPPASATVSCCLLRNSPAISFDENPAVSASVRSQLFGEILGRPRALGDYALILIGVPYRIRTGVAAVRGRCPGPLDEGDDAPPVK
jgi:hypothetical protein